MTFHSLSVSLDLTLEFDRETKQKTGNLVIPVLSLQVRCWKQRILFFRPSILDVNSRRVDWSLSVFRGIFGLELEHISFYVFIKSHLSVNFDLVFRVFIFCLNLRKISAPISRSHQASALFSGCIYFCWYVPSFFYSIPWLTQLN
jgi:hypothetical protein